MKKILILAILLLSNIAFAQKATQSIENVQKQKNLIVLFKFIKTEPSGTYSNRFLNVYTKDNISTSFENITNSGYLVSIQTFDPDRSITKEEENFKFQSGVKGNFNIVFEGSDLIVDLKSKTVNNFEQKDIDQKKIHLVTKLNKHELIELGNGYKVDMAIHELTKEDYF